MPSGYPKRMFGEWEKYKWYLVAEFRAQLSMVAAGIGSIALLAARQPRAAAVYAALMLLTSRRLAAGFPTKSEGSLAGKTAVITGCNTGIGYETALSMAKQGCCIVFCCRSEAKAKAAMAEITKAVPGADLIFVHCDLGDFARAKASAEEIMRLYNGGNVASIDFLVNNAGLFLSKADLVDGVEAHLAVNHLAPVIFTETLLPAVVKSKGRVINVASIAHNWFHMKDEQAPVAGYLARLLVKVKDGYRAPQYGLSKMFNIVYAKHLARRLDGTGAAACSLHPGAVMTNVFRDVKGMAKAVISVMQYTNMKTPVEGAQTTLHCVYTSSIVNGGYYVDAEHRPDCLRRPGLSEKDVDDVMDWTFQEAQRVVGLSRPQY